MFLYYNSICFKIYLLTISICCDTIILMIENCYYVMYEFHLLPDGRSRQTKTPEGRILGAFVFGSVGLLPVNLFAIF